MAKQFNKEVNQGTVKVAEPEAEVMEATGVDTSDVADKF
jgi:hypothetical protein